MLTLKIIHTDFEGGKTTHLFAGERITHSEVETTDHAINFNEEHDFFLIGKHENELSKQPYVTSTVRIFDGNDDQTIHLLPLCDCFVMANGKTIDVFSSYYK
jgi:hypothetical protein